MTFAKTSKNHKLASLKMVRKSPKSRDESDKNDFWNILGFVGFLATTCIVMGVIVSGNHHGAHAIARRSVQNMNYYGKFFHKKIFPEDSSAFISANCFCLKGNFFDNNVGVHIQE